MFIAGKIIFFLLKIKLKKINFLSFFSKLSAGVGRTGTYIAVDIIRRLIKQENDLFTMELDVMGIVYQLRQDRGKMVQTKVNFNLLIKFILFYFIGSICIS